jgi:hypothetical protein
MASPAARRQRPEPVLTAGTASQAERPAEPEARQGPQERPAACAGHPELMGAASRCRSDEDAECQGVRPEPRLAP